MQMAWPQVPMDKYRGRKKSSFESIKGVSSFIVKIPFIALASKMSKSDYIGVVVNKAKRVRKIINGNANSCRHPNFCQTKILST